MVKRKKNNSSIDKQIREQGGGAIFIPRTGETIKWVGNQSPIRVANIIQSGEDIVSVEIPPSHKSINKKVEIIFEKLDNIISNYQEEVNEIIEDNGLSKEELIKANDEKIKDTIIESLNKARTQSDVGELYPLISEITDLKLRDEMIRKLGTAAYEKLDSPAAKKEMIAIMGNFPRYEPLDTTKLYDLMNDDKITELTIPVQQYQIALKGKTDDPIAQAIATIYAMVSSEEFDEVFNFINEDILPGLKADECLTLYENLIDKYGPFLRMRQLDIKQMFIDAGCDLVENINKPIPPSTEKQESGFKRLVSKLFSRKKKKKEQ